MPEVRANCESVAPGTRAVRATSVPRNPSASALLNEVTQALVAQQTACGAPGIAGHAQDAAALARDEHEAPAALRVEAREFCADATRGAGDQCDILHLPFLALVNASPMRSSRAMVRFCSKTLIDWL